MWYRVWYGFHAHIHVRRVCPSHGKATSTLQRWDRTGVLAAHRTVTNRRYYTHDQYLSVMGLPPEPETTRGKRTVIYTRVSSRGRRGDLDNQERFLRQWANARGLIVDEVWSDIGSGMNFKRKNFNRIMYSDDLEHVIIAHKDRLTRFGYDWFEHYLNRRGVTVTVVNNEQLSPQEELVQDLVSIIHVFSGRIHGLRRYAKDVREDESLPYGTRPDPSAG
ncbi:IS607 family transposase [Bifidobacterium pseudolongum]|nr:IS607 family transposase [Bifidobacterium pseudolongum]UBY93837.1 IS607 family transposase [Bifidobacterium pseudolongum]UBZ02671.1 IS607 family transposase [Bifidobacterium pseudolongum]UBZ04241.1 IS607 family transposase [Bifidobacterium pseudolongum]UDL23253.1 IS607 family transposase [Bifidobacterium pseudolongum]